MVVSTKRENVSENDFKISFIRLRILIAEMGTKIIYKFFLVNLN